MPTTPRAVSVCSPKHTKATYQLGPSGESIWRSRYSRPPRSRSSFRGDGPGSGESHPAISASFDSVSKPTDICPLRTRNQVSNASGGRLLTIYSVDLNQAKSIAESNGSALSIAEINGSVRRMAFRSLSDPSQPGILPGLMRNRVAQPPGGPNLHGNWPRKSFQFVPQAEIHGCHKSR